MRQTAPINAGTIALQGGVDFEIEYIKINGKDIEPDTISAIQPKDKLVTLWGSLKR